MKQLVQSMRTGAVDVLDVPPPSLLGPGVLVQTAASLISAGTERHVAEFAKASLLDKARSRPDLVKQVLEKVRRDGLAQAVSAALARLDRPVAPGYATAGTVIAVARGVDDVRVGDRVACAGATYATHAEINYVPRNLVVPVPRRLSGEDVGFDEAAFTTMGAIAMHGIRLGAPELGQRVVVIGLGMIGLLATQILRVHGCRVFGIDPNPARCSLARALGADDADTPTHAEAIVSRWTGGAGADLVVVAAGTADSEPALLAAELACDKGRIVAIGATRLDLPRRTLYRKELSLIVSRSYGPGRYDPEYEELGRDYPRAYVRWTERENMRTFLELIAGGRIDVRPLISHRFGIEHAADAYRALERGDALGILIEYADAPVTLPAAMPVPSRRARAGTAARPRISVIGAGAFARSVLLPSLREAGADLREIVAATGLSARSAADRFGFAFCATSADAVWRGDCDGVVIATRHDSHAQLTIDALQAGKPVFVEKPLCVTEAELERLEGVVEGLRARGPMPFVMVGFNRRFAPAVAALRRAMRGAPVSLMYRVNAGRLAPDSWIAHPQQGGGRVIGELCHFIDLCAYVADSRIADVCATRSAADPDDVMVTLRMTNGSMATVAYLVDGDRASAKERIEVFGGGCLGTIDDFRRARVSGHGRTARHGRFLPRQDKGHAAEMAAFVSAVASGADSPVSWESAVNTTRATLAVVRSLESGERVYLP